MSSREIVDWFNDLAPRAFDFLRTEFAMTGPTSCNDAISFESPDLAIAIGLDRHDGIRVNFQANSGERKYRASINCLYVASGLGPAQSVKSTARTRHTLQQSLQSNASALRELLPRLRADNRDSLFAACHGR